MTSGGRLLPAALVAGALALSACASAPRGTTTSPPRPLAPPAAAGEQAVSQVVRAGADSRELTLSCVVSVKDGVMSVVGLNTIGVRLFTMTYDGTQVRVEKSSGIPDAITPDRLLADLQLVYWPMPQLRDTLLPAGFEVSEPAPGTRKLRYRGRLVAEVHYANAGSSPDGRVDPWNGRAWLVSLEFGYSLQIDSQAL